MSQFAYDVYALVRLRQQELLREAANDQLADQLGYRPLPAARGTLPSPRAAVKALACWLSRPSAASAT